MPKALIFSRRLLGCGLIILIIPTQVLMAQADTSDQPQLGLIISTRIDTAGSHRGALGRLLGEGRGEKIVNSVDQQCHGKINSLLADQGITIPVVVGGVDSLAYPGVDKWVYLVNTLSVDAMGIYTARSGLLFTDRSQPMLAFRRKLMESSTSDDDTKIDSLTTTLSHDVAQIIARWLVEEAYKIRVVVSNFEGSDLDTNCAFLSQGIRSMVESEVARNEAFLVYSARDTIVGSSISGAYANYRIKGTYFCFENSVRVDIHCLKTRSGRILLSRSITLDTLSLSKLSGQVTLAMNRMKKAMVASERRVSKTLAIVAEPPTLYFRAKGVSRDVIDIARLFRKNVANRLRRFVHSRQEHMDSLRLDIYDDADILDHYVESYHDPGEIISDLAADYLILLKIEDLGQRLCVTATLHSYSTDSLFFGYPVYTGDDNKAGFRNLIDETLLDIAKTMVDLKLLKDSVLEKADLEGARKERGAVGERKLRDSLISEIASDTKDVRVLDIRPNKACGFRLGGIQHHDDRLFLGRRTSEYLEIFYSYLLPHRSWMRSWMALEMEAAVGLDYGGGTLFRRGLTCLNLFLELRLVITSLQYSNLPITVAFGGGGGIGGISIKYRANEAPYAGSSDFEDAVSRGLGTASARVEFPIVSWLRLQVLSRWLFQSGSPISRFENVPFDTSVEGPVGGKLDSRHICVGFKIVFR